MRDLAAFLSLDGSRNPSSRRAHRAIAWVFATSVALAGVLGSQVQAQSAREYLYVENTRSGDIAVISIPDHEIVGRIPESVVGGHPDDVIATRAGDLIYVNREDYEDVLAIDTASESVLFRVEVSGIPHHMTLSADEQLLFVPIFNYPRLDVISTKDRSLITSVELGWGAHGTRLSPNGRYLFVGHIFHERFTVVDVDTLEVVRVIDMPEGVRPFEISPDGALIYAQLSNVHGFVVVDVQTGEILRTVHMSPTMSPDQLSQPFPFTVNHGLALTPDGKALLAAGSVTDNVVIYSLPDMRRLADIKVGREPNWIIFNNDISFAYVTNRGDDTVSVISMSEFREVKRIEGVGSYPQRMDTAFVDRSKRASR